MNKSFIIAVECLDGLLTKKLQEVIGDEAINLMRNTDYLLFRSLTSGNNPISLDLDAVTVHRFIGSRLSLHGR